MSKFLSILENALDQPDPNWRSSGLQKAPQPFSKEGYKSGMTPEEEKEFGVIYPEHYTIKVTFDDGDSLVTRITGDKRTVWEYYMGKPFTKLDPTSASGEGTHTVVGIDFLNESKPRRVSTQRLVGDDFSEYSVGISDDPNYFGNSNRAEAQKIAERLGKLIQKKFPGIKVITGSRKTTGPDESVVHDIIEWVRDNWTSALRESAEEDLMQHDCRGAGEPSWWEYDAQGIALDRVCDVCRKVKLSKYRPEILSGYGQEDVNEPIDYEY